MPRLRHHPPSATQILKRAGEVCGFAAKEYADKVKVAKFGAECEAAGVGLVPMVVETFGRWGAGADQVFDFAKASAARGNATAERASAFLRRSLAVCLQCSNVQSTLGRLDPSAPTLEQPVELALEGPEDSVFVDDMRELLLDGCQCAVGGVCECELPLLVGLSGSLFVCSLSACHFNLLQLSPLLKSFVKKKRHRDRDRERETERQRLKM